MQDDTVMYHGRKYVVNPDRPTLYDAEDKPELGLMFVKEIGLGYAVYKVTYLDIASECSDQEPI